MPEETYQGKNASRKDLRRARQNTTDGSIVRDLTIKFHELLQLHSKAKGVSIDLSKPEST